MDLTKDFKAPSSTSLIFGVAAFTENGTRFDNISSLDITWRVSDNVFVSPLFPYSFFSLII